MKHRAAHTPPEEHALKYFLRGCFPAPPHIDRELCSLVFPPEQTSFYKAHIRRPRRRHRKLSTPNRCSRDSAIAPARGPQPRRTGDWPPMQETQPEPNRNRYLLGLKNLSRAALDVRETPDG